MIAKQINIQDAKAHLSKYVRRLKEGESFVLCERNVPVAEIHPIHPRKRHRRLGILKGAVLSMSEQFNNSLTPEEQALFDGGPL